MWPKPSYNSLKLGEIMHQLMHKLLNPNQFSNLEWQEVEVSIPRLWSLKYQHEQNNSTETIYKFFSFCFPHKFGRERPWTVSMVSRFSTSSSQPSYTNIKRLFRYRQSTLQTDFKNRSQAASATIRLQKNELIVGRTPYLPQVQTHQA